MNGEVNNNENKKKQKIAALVGLITLLLAVLGATYAFFQLDTDTESSNTSITGSTPDKSLVTLNQEISNLHLNISASDMSLNNVNNEYYATDVDGKAYEDNEEDGTKTIASVELTGGEATTKYSCTAKLTVSKVTVPEEEATDVKDMIEVLQPGDMILQFKGNIISEKLDLSELNPDGSKEYNLKFKVTGTTPEEIQAYIKLINKETSQNYLAGSKLNIDIDTSDLKCEVALPDPKIAELRAKDKEISEGIEHISTDEQGGMYRYQGTDDVPNWICFGTTDKEQCTNEDTGIDKYMYRIIGITYYGEMYLLKETFLKEGETTEFGWNHEFKIDGFSDEYLCTNGICPEWNQSDLFKRINGIANGTNAGAGGYGSSKADTDIFVDSEYYDYLKSDGKNSEAGKEINWYNLIANHSWHYGDTAEHSESKLYNGDEMYAIETGNAETTHNVKSESGTTKQTYSWTNKVDAKVSLMYLHDILYAYPGGTPGNLTNVQNSWVNFRKDGYNQIKNYNYEWLSTRFGIYENESFIFARYVAFNGDLFEVSEIVDATMSSGNTINRGYGVRPVFYLSSDVKIKEGTDGTKANPYILDVQA